MKAVTLGEIGVELSEVDPPEPEQNQVLVKVHACGLNRSDLLETQGQSFGHLGGKTKILGGEFAGEIAEIGMDVEGYKIGDRVMCRGGAGWAEYAIADWRRTVKVQSKEISYEQAACQQGAMQTMHDAIITNAQFSAGQTILFLGASSGVGLMGMQIARTMGAKLIIGTSSNPGRRQRLPEFGADLILDTEEDNWDSKILDSTDGNGVDVTIDMLSGHYVNKAMEVTKVHGYIVNIGRLAGMTADFNFDRHAARRLHYIGTTGRSRSIDEHAEVQRRANEDLGEAIRLGEIASPVDMVFPLSEADKALDRMNSNEHFGKIILLA